MDKFREDKRYVCCPACGKVLQKSKITNSEIKCWNCGDRLAIYVRDGVVIIAESTIEEQRLIFDSIDSYFCKRKN